MTVQRLQCPHCEAGPASIMGHENPHVYDGVLFWSCLVCGKAWPRKFPGMDLRQIASENAAELWNDPRGVRGDT